MGQPVLAYVSKAAAGNIAKRYGGSLASWEPWRGSSEARLCPAHTDIAHGGTGFERQVS